jgi:hypothetical protein
MIRTLIFHKHQNSPCFEIHEDKIIAYTLKYPADRVEVNIIDDQDGWGEYLTINDINCYISNQDAYSVVLSPNGLVFEVNNKPYPF